MWSVWEMIGPETMQHTVFWINNPGGSIPTAVVNNLAGKMPAGIIDSLRKFISK